MSAAFMFETVSSTCHGCGDEVTDLSVRVFCEPCIDLHDDRQPCLSLA
jgi:hypothetical protein